MAGPYAPATADSSQLDGPPPSPTAMGGAPDAGPTGSFSMKGLTPQTPGNQMPPEILTGLMQAAQTIGSLLDSFAQVTPDQATKLALIKDLLQQYLAEVTTQGAGPTSPTAAGPAAPMGGIDRGVAGAGSV